MSLATVLNEVRAEQEATLAAILAATNDMRRSVGLPEAEPFRPSADVRGLSGQIDLAAEILHATAARARRMIEEQLGRPAAACRHEAGVKPVVSADAPAAARDVAADIPAMLAEPVVEVTPRADVLPEPIRGRMEPVATEPVVAEPSRNGHGGRKKRGG